MGHTIPTQCFLLVIKTEYNVQHVHMNQFCNIFWLNPKQWATTNIIKMLKTKSDNCCINLAVLGRIPLVVDFAATKSSGWKAARSAKTQNKIWFVRPSRLQTATNKKQYITTAKLSEYKDSKLSNIFLNENTIITKTIIHILGKQGWKSSTWQSRQLPRLHSVSGKCFNDPVSCQVYVVLMVGKRNMRLQH